MKVFRKQYKLFLVLVCSVLFFCEICNASDGLQDQPLQLVGVEPTTRLEMVWIEHASGQSHLYHTEFTNQSWQPKKLIVSSDNLLVTPCVASKDNDSGVLVWSARMENSTELYYIQHQDETWSLPKKIETNLSSNLSPVLTYDKDGQLWMAWVGFDGVDDDIFFSRWDGVAWDLPVRVHIDNVTPDLFPLMGIDPGGALWIQWSGYEDDGYHQFRSSWNGHSWDEKQAMAEKAVVKDGLLLEPVVEEDIVQVGVTAQESGTGLPVIALPSFVVEPERALINIFGSNKEIQSLPLRDFFSE